MRLADLSPELHGTVAHGRLEFDCPHHGCTHRVRVAISAAPFHERDPENSLDMVQRNGKVKVWQASGAFPESLSLEPSVNIVDEAGRTLCWHGFITAGAVTV